MLQSKIIDVGRLTYEGSLAGLPCPAAGARERSDVNGHHRSTFALQNAHPLISWRPCNHYHDKPSPRHSEHVVKWRTQLSIYLQINT